MSSDDKLKQKPRKRSKRKKKSPSVLARDRARIRAFWKRVKASKKAQSQSPRLEEPRIEAIQTEKPDLLEPSSSVSKVVKDPTNSRLTVGEEAVILDPIQVELSELSAEGAESVHSTILLDSSEELDCKPKSFDERYTEYILTHSYSTCANCNKIGNSKDLKLCTGCKSMRYCSKNCQITDWPSHKQLCLAIQTLPSSE